MRHLAIILALGVAWGGGLALADPPSAGATLPSPAKSGALPLEAPPPRDSSGIPRLSMPRERIDGWIRDAGVKYLRVPAAQFERLAAAKDEPSAGDRGDDHRDATYLRGARLSAKLSDDGALVGRALLDVHHLADAPRFVALSPCTLALRDSDDQGGGRWLARWIGQPPRPATLGMGDDGRLGVLVERSGELEAAWSLRSRSAATRADAEARPDGGGLSFRWEMPAATISTLDLDLPARWTPRASRGVTEPLGDAGPQRKRWRIRLPAATSHELRLEDGSVPAPRADVAFRQALTYRLWPQGIDLQADLSLDVAGGPLDALELDLTPGLVLLAASTGADQRISWSSTGTASAPRVRLNFPQPLAGSKQNIRLEATAPLRFDRPLTLPSVSPRNVFWQEGLATIWMAKSLSLGGVQARGGVQSSGLAPQSLDRYQGSQFGFRLLGPEAVIEILVSRSRSRLEVSQATSLTWGASELRGRTIAEVACLEGECFELWAEVGASWKVEVEPRGSLPVDGEVERGVDPVALGAPPNNPRASQFVHVRFARPIRAGETARLTLTGRHTRSSGSRLSSALHWDDLQMVAFPQARPRQTWLNVEAVRGAVRLGLASGVRELSPSDLTLAQRPLFDQPPRGLLLAVEAMTPQVEVVAEEPRGSAAENPKATAPSGTTLNITTSPAAAPHSAAAKEADSPPTAAGDLEAPPPGGAIVRRVHLTSRYQAVGPSRQEAIFEVDNDALSAARLLLPEGAAEIEVHADGARAMAQAAASEALEVPLSRGRRTIRVGYTVTASRLGFFTAVEALLPRWQSGDADLPVLECAWTIALPLGYEVASVPGWQARAPTGLSWAERLFGPLARATPDRLEGQPAKATLAGAGMLANGRSESRPRLSARERSTTYVGTADLPLVARLVRRSALATVGWLLFLLVAVGVWCLALPGRRAPGLAAAVLLATVLLSPTFCVPVAAGAFWGLAAGLAMRSLWPRGGQAATTTAPVSPPRGSSLRAARTALGALWLLGVAGHASHSGAVESTVWPVIVPSDVAASSDEGQVVYVPESLWERLRERSPVAARPSAWIIERAEYVGRLAPPAPGGVSAASLTATFSIRTALSPARVRLDFGASLGVLRPLEAILDGQVVALSWDAASRVATFDIPQAGLHALEVPLRTSVRADGPSWRLEHPVPPVAGAQVRLSLPSAQTTADVVSSLGLATRQGRALRGELGAADRIVVRWQDETTAAPPRPVDVEQLLWLRIKARAVTLRAKWVCDAGRGLARQFRVVADRELRLNGDFRDGDVRDGAPAKIRHDLESPPSPRAAVGPQVFDLALDPPRSGGFTIECEFLVEDAYGVGRLRLPRVMGGAAKLDHQRVAVSVDASLKYEETGFKGVSAAAIAKFLEDWGDGDGRPDFVRMAQEIGPPWSIQLRPHDVDRAVQQTLRADFGAERVDLTWEANIACTGGPCFQHRLAVPKGLVTQQITVTEGSQVREAEWTEVPGMLNVFLREKAAGSQRIALRGYLPISTAGPTVVPVIQCEQAATTSAETRLFQQPGVRIARVMTEAPRTSKGGAAKAGVKDSFVDAVPLAPPASSAGDPPGSRGLGAFATPPGAKLHVELQPNRPSVRSPILITTVRREADQWMAGVEFDALADDVETITFRGPAGLPAPTLSDPPGRVERQSTGGQTRWHLWPKSQLVGHSRIRLSWRLAAPTGQRLELPAIDPLITSSAARFLAVSKDVTTAPERWEPVDLVPIKSWDEVLAAGGDFDPKNPAHQPRMAKLREDLAGYDLFRLESGRPLVLRRVLDDQAVAPARAAVDWQATSERGYHALATFTWPGGGPASAKLRLPEGTRPLRSAWRAASASDDKPAPAQAAMMTRLEDGLWQASFGPQPPRSFEVLLAGSRTSPLMGDCELKSVELANTTIEETAWTVALLPGSEAALPREAELRQIDGRLVVSLTLPGGDGHALRLAVRAASGESWWRRLGTLAVLLGIGGGLAWCIARWRIDPRWLVWVGAPAGLAWWLWLSPASVGLLVLVLVVVVVLDHARPAETSATTGE